MAVIFLFILIRLEEKYLTQKYDEEFVNYAANTKKLVPMIY